MNIKWFKKFKDKKERERFKSLALSNLEVFQTLRGILEDELKASQKDSYNKSHYLLPCWKEFQADKKGEQRTLQKVIDLLPED